MKAKEDFDAALGGTVQLPDQIQSYKFTADRVNEIKSLLSSINNPSQTKLVFQTLPKHMRRRAMSHNPKRLPRKYRQAHIAQMRKSGVGTISKRPSRKYRRKAGNLQREYIRRQRNHVWLETHIWHAKRFHMVERWGYKLAQSSCDKTFRSNYRATAKHCLVQDISYVGCIEINGTVPMIREAFQRMTSSNGLGVTAKTYLNGNREGTIDLYRRDMYPIGSLGRVSFIWKPVIEDTAIRMLWLFVHPSFYKEVVEELVNLLKLIIDERLDKDQLLPPKYSNQMGNVTLVELRNTLNRFRLTGPLSQAVLAKAFKCKSIDANATNTAFGCFLSSDEGSAAHQSQSNYWSSVASITSPAELFPNMVLALNIEDPRINRPVKRTKALPEVPTICTQSVNPAALVIPQHSSVSALWSLELRTDVTTQKMTTREFCQLRNKHCLVPGERCGFEERLQPVPLILVQRPGSQNAEFKRLGYGCGWDVIVPSEYGISTWMCLIMWGARAGGLREVETINREGGCEEFHPDTTAAQQIAVVKYHELRNAYFKKPQNKRENFKKLSIASPFRCNWLQLVQEWTPSTKDFYVLRDRQQLEQVQQICAMRLPFSALKISQSNCLIPVHLTMSTRGSPGDFSIICAPKPGDLNRNSRKLRQFDNEPVYTEPLKMDLDERERKQLRTNHLKLLKRLRRRRVRAKKRKQETADRRVLIAKPGTAKLIAEQLKKMRELWLPETTQSVRHQCTREVVGYMTQGNFSFIEATVAGVGYITLNGLKKLLNNCEKAKKGSVGGCRVLVRGTNTRQYRLATVKVLTS